jgi:hypothetical protein
MTTLQLDLDLDGATAARAAARQVLVPRQPGERPVFLGQIVEGAVSYAVVTWDGLAERVFSKGRGKGTARRAERQARAALEHEQHRFYDVEWQWTIAERTPAIVGRLPVELVPKVLSDSVNWEDLDLDHQTGWRMVRIPSVLPSQQQVNVALCLEGDDHNVAEYEDEEGLSLFALFPPDDGRWECSDDTVRWLVDRAIRHMCGRTEWWESCQD